jgi:thioredoxin reductase/NAD-dependent dihydropyrimidine dehydrogenase PreA subunit
MDFLMEVFIEEIVIYGGTIILSLVIIFWYLKKQSQHSLNTEKKIEKAKEEGRYEPVSLHPYVDLSTCIGSGACISSCPEKDILGIVNGKAYVVNAASCVGHGACFHACPVEAISLRIGTEKRGVDLPHVHQSFETNIKGIYIAGELGGMGLIKNSVEQGKQAVENLAKNRPSKKDNLLDLVIVGAGPAGISAALKAKELGLDFLVMEQYTLGGTVYSFPRQKIVMTQPMDLPKFGKVKLFNTSKDELLTIWNNALQKNEIKVNEDTKIDKIVMSADGTFKVIDAKGTEYFTHQVLIAIGRRGTPRKLGVPGESLPKVFYRLLEPEHFHNEDIIVVGGGDSAIESALLLADQNKVKLSYRKDKFSRLKEQNRKRITDAHEKGKLEIIYNSNLKNITAKEVEIEIDGNVTTVPNDLIYIFAGGELPTQFLKNAGIEIQKRFGYIMKSFNKKK